MSVNVRGLLNNLHEPISLEQMRLSPVGTSALQPKDGPSLQETLDWLKEKIPLGNVHYQASSYGSVDSFNTQATVWSFDSCSVVFGDVTTMTPEGHPDLVPSVFTARCTLPLGILSGGSVVRAENVVEHFTFVSGEQWGYRLYLIGPKEFSLSLSSSGPATYSDSRTTNSLFVTFNDESLAQRVLAAFKHAAELCRKKEPF